jgi:heterodisulfide reductase subunit C
MIVAYEVRRITGVESDLAHEITRDLGIDISRCLECGKCSGGCSYAQGFDYTPRKIIQLIKLNDRDTLLGMDSLWTCLACQLCVDRCPSKIDIPRIMDYLRTESHLKKKNKNKQNIEKFYELMLDEIQKRGRLNEMMLMIRYNLAIKDYFNDVALGQKMFFKGKLKFLSPHIKDMNALQIIFKELI